MGSSTPFMHQLSLQSLTFNWLPSGKKADKLHLCYLMFPGDMNIHIAGLTKFKGLCYLRTTVAQRGR